MRGREINILPGLTPWKAERLAQMKQTEAESSHYLTLSDMSSQICDQTSQRWHTVHLLLTSFFFLFLFCVFFKQTREQPDNAEAMLPPNAKFFTLQAPEAGETPIWLQQLPSDVKGRGQTQKNSDLA